jgi:lipopolysaccharide/colanic/teichoic acid biosynthesis glycosyltransferase
MLGFPTLHPLGTLVKLQYDLFYSKRQSFYLDMVILIRTAITMLFRRGQ